jgi:transcriptional regulator with XRE-family HTH domain
MDTRRGNGRPVGELLRQWRTRRRLSQLDLANLAEVSTRHLSFVETGRAAPSREMILHLTEHLEVPLRERNRLLLAAGYAPVYRESTMDDPGMAAVRQTLRQVMVAHEPFPAAVADRHWNLVDANAAAAVFLAGVAPSLLRPPVNVMRLSLHPQGLAARIVNLGQWRSHQLSRLRRQVEFTGDDELAALYREMLACPGPEPSDVDIGPTDVVLPLRVRHEGQVLTFLSLVATFGAPLDVGVAELVIESFFPADRATTQFLQAQASRPEQAAPPLP